MPKELTISLNGNLVPISIEKVDRSDLYGQIISETLDAGVKCSRVSVLMDGTILGSGSTAKALMIDGSWIEEQDTSRWTPEGTQLLKRENSFKVPPLAAATVRTEDLLNYCVKSVYALDKHITDAKLDFNYTAGYPKPAFLIQGADGNGYMLIGEPAQVSWVGHQDTCLTGETDEWEEDEISELFS